MTPDQIRHHTGLIARDLDQASQLLAAAHYRVQQLSHRLELPTPSTLHVLAQLAQASAAVSERFDWITDTPQAPQCSVSVTSKTEEQGVR